MRYNGKNKKAVNSTQKFIEIKDIVDDVVLFANGSACLIVEVQATNFSLLSADEQGAKIAAYAALLNSLSFPIQIVIRNKRVDISSYIKLLDAEAEKTPNEKLQLQISLYRDFIQEVVKVNTVLDKKFYIIIPYSPLEKTPAEALKKGDQGKSAVVSLHTKSESLMAQFSRLSLGAHVLDKESLVRLFYEIYNQPVGESINIEEASASPIVKAQNTQP